MHLESKTYASEETYSEGIFLKDVYRGILSSARETPMIIRIEGLVAA